jgi:hypothetical protein
MMGFWWPYIIGHLFYKIKVSTSYYMWTTAETLGSQELTQVHGHLLLDTCKILRRELSSFDPCNMYL